MGCFNSSMVIPQTKFFKSDEQLRVYIDENSHVIYEPLNEKRRIGVIFYPGFKANHKRYSNIAFNLAQNGYFTVLCSMPCNTAFLAPNRASSISEVYSTQVDKWVLGGHSLGGIMATKFIYNNYKSQNLIKTFSGLFLLGSRGDKSYDISNFSIPTLVIHGELDGIITKEENEDSLKYLPLKTTIFKLLNGANHSFFGDFPVAKIYWMRDNQATISQEEQINQTIVEMLQFLKKF